MMDLFIIWCTAPDDFFELDPERVKPSIMHQLVGKGTPCEGGVPGKCCFNCPFVDGELKTDAKDVEDF